jgi:uncharacterized protein YbaR (Trm112 family)/SAM-dependent methyltransferase
MKSKKVKHNMYKLLACPACKTGLDFDLNKEYFCKTCSIRYPIQDEVVNFLSKDCDTSDIDAIRPESKLKIFLRKIYMTIKVSNTFKTKRSRNRIPSLINSLNPDDFSINIGAGNTNYSPKIINLDVEKTENGDIVADSRNLPIRSSSVSLVISQAVLEHTPDTNLNIEEIDRILKNNGLLYIEVPWMQTYHAHPHDYFRFTHQGLKSYLKNYDIIDQGIAVGPASAMSLNLRIFLATLFSFGNKSLFIIFGVVFAWLTFPLKYLDFFLESNPLSYHSASGIYVLARKKN